MNDLSVAGQRMISTTAMRQPARQSTPGPPNRSPGDGKKSRTIGRKDDIARLQKVISDYKTDNTRMSSLIEHLDGSLVSIDQRRLLFKDFEAEMERLSERLSDRRKRIVEKELVLRSFKFPGADDIHVEKASPRTVKTESAPRLEPNRMTYSRTGFVVTPLGPRPEKATMTMTATSMSTMAATEPRAKRVRTALKHMREDAQPPKQEQAGRQELIKDNEELRTVALNQARLILLQKMKLKLCHDHRDLSALRKILDDIIGEKPTIDDERAMAEVYKVKIGNLKSRIAGERRRIEWIANKATTDDKAAIKIQSAMRGFLHRRENKKRVSVMLTTARSGTGDNDS